MPEKQEQKRKSPQLALIHNELQGGAANGRNVSLLMKADAEITPEVEEILKRVLGTQQEASEDKDIEKSSYKKLKSLLEASLKSKIGGDFWLYVEDFDDSSVVFYTDEECYFAPYYKDEDGVIVVGQVEPVTSFISYQKGDGSLVLSEGSGLTDGVQSLIRKSLEKGSDKLTDIIKSNQQKEEVRVKEEIQKAVSEATEALMVELEKAKEQIQEMEKAKQEAIQESRKKEMSEIVKDAEEVEQLMKATESLDKESFDIIVKSLKAKSQALEDSDLFDRVSDVVDVEKSQENLHETLLKQKYNIQ